MRLRLALLAGLLAAVGRVFGDPVFPATFEVVEQDPDRFTLTLTLPVVTNVVLDLQPALPDVLAPDGEPVGQTGVKSTKQTWQAHGNPDHLVGQSIGLDGLLGIDLEVRFLLQTLDGRRHEQTLKSTQPVFTVPAPPAPGELAVAAILEGLRVATRHLGLWSVLAVLVVLGAAWRRRTRTAVFLAVLLLSPFTAIWSGSLALPLTGLSGAEIRLATGLLTGAWITAGGLMTAFLLIADSLLSGRPRHRIHQLVVILAAAWLYYEVAGWVTRHGPGLWMDLQRLADRFVYGWLSPFSADWAMARLRIPWLSLAVLLAGFWLLRRSSGSRRRRAGITAVALLLAVLLLPWGVTRTRLPFLHPDAPSPAQARRILEPMLSRIYKALDLEEETRAYDRLAEDVAGELVTGLYLDSRKRLLEGTRQGAVVEVLDVDVVAAGTPRAGTDDQRIFTYPCRWTVTAKVTHWQHSHERRNLYAGELALTVAGDRWKLAGLELRSAEREVVPGSFTSR